MSEFICDDCAYTFILCRVNRDSKLPMTVNYEMFWDEEVLDESDAVHHVEEIVNRIQLQLPMFIADDKKYVFGFVLSGKSGANKYTCDEVVGYVYDEHTGTFDLFTDTYCGECEESVYDLVRAMTCNMANTKRDSSFFMKFWSLHTDVPTTVNIFDMFDKNTYSSEVQHAEAERVYPFTSVPTGFHVIEHNNIHVCFCGELIVNAFKNTVKEFARFSQKEVEPAQQPQDEEPVSQKIFSHEFFENEVFNG